MVFTKGDLTSMEACMLKAIEYRVAISGSKHCFLVRYLKAAHADSQLVWLSNFIVERSLQEYSMVQFAPSLVASCAIYLARKNLQRAPWSCTLHKYTGYTEDELYICTFEISRALKSSSAQVAANKKYSSSKFGAVSSIHLEGV